jgi:hypothetical protein
MTQGPDVDPIADDEVLCRRIPASTGWYGPSRSPPLEPEAFRPNKNDTHGLSVSRQKYKSVEQAARGQPGKTYFVALLRAGDIRAAGMEVVPRPLPDDPGHAEIPELTYDTRKSKLAIEWRTRLAGELCLYIEGPLGASE